MVFSLQILGRLRASVGSHGLVAFVVGVAALTGCGQKGPLFLPLPPKLAATSLLQPSGPVANAAVITPGQAASAAQ